MLIFTPSSASGYQRRRVDRSSNPAFNDSQLDPGQGRPRQSLRSSPRPSLRSSLTPPPRPPTAPNSPSPSSLHTEHTRPRPHRPARSRGRVLPSRAVISAVAVAALWLWAQSMTWALAGGCSLWTVGQVASGGTRLCPMAVWRRAWLNLPSDSLDCLSRLPLVVHGCTSGRRT